MSDAEADHEPSTPTPEEQEAAHRLFNVVRLLRSIHPRMNVQTAIVFAHVAENQGQTVAELAERCDESAAVMSRHLKNLGSVNRRNRTGMELVTLVQRAYGDRREKRAVLTERGVRLSKLILEALIEERPRPIRSKSPTV